MANQQLEKSVDSFWDGWLNSLKVVQQFQENAEKNALQAFTYQKEVIESTVSALHAIEKESQKIAKEWNEKAHQALKDKESNSQLDDITTWFNSVQEITNKAQSLAWQPSNVLVDLFVQSHQNLETALKRAVDYQKQERVETINKITELAEQLKTAQKQLLAVK